EIAIVADVECATFLIHDDAVKQPQLGGEGVHTDEEFHLAFDVDTTDALLVDDEQPLLKGSNAARIVESRGEGNGLALVDQHHRSIAILVVLADYSDIDLAARHRNR